MRANVLGFHLGRGGRAAIACLALLFALSAQVEARPFTDAAGRTVELPETVTRVLAAGPPASVLLYTLVPDKLAGWVSAPAAEAKPFLVPAARDLPVFGRLTGRGGTANVEMVLSAKPDLIVDVGSIGATYASLADRVQAQTGIPYVLLDGSFTKTPETYRQLGVIVGAQARGDMLASEAERMMREIESKLATVPPDKRPRVYYGRGPKGLETGLAGSINTEILDAAGADNVAAAAGSGGLATVSPEQVLAWNPDIILTLDESVRAAVLSDPVWSGLPAVRDKRVYRAPNLPFGWFDAPPGVNRLIGLSWLAALFHPDLFPQDLRETTRAFYKTFYAVELTGEQLDTLLAGATGPAR